MQKGKSSIEFEHPPVVTSYASIAGKKEGYYHDQDSIL